MNFLLKYPIGIQDFARIRQDHYLYIDKTKHILNITKSGAYYFISRPRRFGKSLLMSTLLYLYQGRKDLFEGLYIEDKWDFEQTNPVIHIPLNEFGRMNKGLEDLLLDSLQEQAARYGVSVADTKLGIGRIFRNLIYDLHQKFGRKVVILIDEYDKPIIDFLDQKEIAEQNKEVLKGFYGILKPSDPHIELVFLTGISRFSHLSIFSDLNNLDDISNQEDFATILGITQSELEHYFAEPLATIAQKKGFSQEEFLQKIKNWYNGYRWNSEETVYNPFSILNFFKQKGDFKNYWFATGTPTFLVKDLAKRGIYELNKLKATTFTLENFELESINPITLLYQAGYLTAIEERRNLCTLDFPNQEVKESFTILMLDQFRSSRQADSFPLVLQIVDAFEEKDISSIFEALNSLFSSIPNQLWREKSEHFYHALTHLTFQLLGVYIKSEVNTSRGRCDSLVETEHYVYALEFKLDGDANAALQQIIDKGYLEPYRNSGKELIALGVNFTTEKKGIETWIQGKI